MFVASFAIVVACLGLAEAATIKLKGKPGETVNVMINGEQVPITIGSNGIGELGVPGDAKVVFQGSQITMGANAGVEITVPQGKAAPSFKATGGEIIVQKTGTNQAAVLQTGNAVSVGETIAVTEGTAKIGTMSADAKTVENSVSVEQGQTVAQVVKKARRQMAQAQEVSTDEISTEDVLAAIAEDIAVSDVVENPAQDLVETCNADLSPSAPGACN